jgi:hypothetical protein
LQDESRVLVVVPAYNEGATVGTVVAQLTSAGHRVLVVDDSSRDATGDNAFDNGASVLRLSQNLGVGGALRAGLGVARELGAPIVVQCDADGQHDIDAISTLVGALRERGDHLVIGSRFGGPLPPPPMARPRWLAMRVLAASASRASGHRLTDTTSGFRAIAAPLIGQLADRMPLQYLGDTFESVMMAARSGYRVSELPVPMYTRQGGIASARGLTSLAFLARASLTAWLRVSGRLVGPGSAPTGRGAGVVTAGEGHPGVRPPATESSEDRANGREAGPSDTSAPPGQADAVGEVTADLRNGRIEDDGPSRPLEHPTQAGAAEEDVVR